MKVKETHVEAEEGEDGRQVDGAAQGRDDAAEQVQVRVRDAGQRAHQLRGRAGEPGQHQPHDDGRVVQAPARTRHETSAHLEQLQKPDPAGARVTATGRRGAVAQVNEMHCQYYY